jgi:hypothetical protein
MVATLIDMIDVIISIEPAAAQSSENDAFGYR